MTHSLDSYRDRILISMSPGLREQLNSFSPNTGLDQWSSNIFPPLVAYRPYLVGKFSELFMIKCPCKQYWKEGKCMYTLCMCPLEREHFRFMTCKPFRGALCCDSRWLLNFIIKFISKIFKHLPLINCIGKDICDWLKLMFIAGGQITQICFAMKLY